MSDTYAATIILVQEYVPTLFMYVVVSISLFGFFIKMIRNDGRV